MDNKSMIFWFSGTGNSLCAAKHLSESLGSLPLRQITNNVPSGVFGGDGGKIGFVFPSYYGNLPRAVQRFVDKLEVLPDTYVFGIVTMGAAGQGSVGELRKAILLCYRNIVSCNDWTHTVARTSIYIMIL